MTVSLRAWVLVALVAACGRCASGGAWPRATRVAREERVRCRVSICDRWFAEVHGLQMVFARAELLRLDASAPLLASLEVSADADPGRAGEALRAMLALRNRTDMPFRVEIGEDADVSLSRWREAFATGAPRALDDLLRDLEAAVTVRWNDPEPPAGMERVRPALEAYLRRSLALERVATMTVGMSEQLVRDRPAVTAAAPTELATECDAAGRWLGSVRARASLQVHGSRRATLWVRGLIAPDVDERDEPDDPPRQSSPKSFLMP